MTASTSLRGAKMLTSSQRDILAGVMTAVYLYDGDGVRYKEWIETYELYRQKINEQIEESEDV